MVIVAIVVGAFILAGIALALSVVGNPLEPEPLDAPDPGLPTDRLPTSEDVSRLRFRVGLRGYRMSDVDAAIDRLQEALRAAEERTRRSAP